MAPGKRRLKTVVPAWDACCGRWLDARVDRCPTRGVHKAAAFNDNGTAFDFLHLAGFQRSNETVDLEVVECKFFFCHNTEDLK